MKAKRKARPEKKHMILVALPPEVHEALVNAARVENRSTRAQAAYLIARALALAN